MYALILDYGNCEVQFHHTLKEAQLALEETKTIMRKNAAERFATATITKVLSSESFPF